MIAPIILLCFLGLTGLQVGETAPNEVVLKDGHQAIKETVPMSNYDGEVEDGGSDEEDSDDEDDSSSSSESDSSSSSSSSSSEEDQCDSSVCPEDGQTSVYSANSDCTKFCQCSNGVAILKNCPSDLHFNPALNVCDWTENANCDNNSSE